jgi:ribosomal protein S21
MRKQHSNFDRKLRTFKRKVQNSGVLEEYRNRMHHKTKAEKRRDSMNAAKRREYRRRMEDTLWDRSNRLY